MRVNLEFPGFRLLHHDFEGEALDYHQDLAHVVLCDLIALGALLTALERRNIYDPLVDVESKRALRLDHHLCRDAVDLQEVLPLLLPGIRKLLPVLHHVLLVPQVRPNVLPVLHLLEGAVLHQLCKRECGRKGKGGSLLMRREIILGGSGGNLLRRGHAQL